jgi:polysaccharide export outer membrane protein
VERRVRAPRFALLALAVVTAALGGCNMRAIPGLTTPDYALSTPAPLPPPLTPASAGIPGAPAVPYPTYRLGSGDQLRVIVFGQDNLSRLYNVDSSGSVALPLIGPIRARGFTTAQLANYIANELKQKYVKDPKVSVEVETYRPFFILGEVNKPGQYPYVNAMTVEAAVAIAEGYTERAKQRMVRLTRKFGGVMSTVMVPPDYPVQPGDTIYVTERFF